MIKNPYQGKFIVFEGIDGSGQSTQAVLLENFFQAKINKPAVLTKEPTEGVFGKKIRSILQGREQIGAFELQELFVKDRAEHLRGVIIPFLKEGNFIICDRYFFSTCAFGGLQLPLEQLIDLNKDFLMPDIIFILDLPAETAVKRIEQRGHQKELFEQVEKLRLVRKNYLHLSKTFADTYLIDGQQPIEQVHNSITKILRDQKII